MTRMGERKLSMLTFDKALKVLNPSPKGSYIPLRYVGDEEATMRQSTVGKDNQWLKIELKRFKDKVSEVDQLKER